MLCKTSFFEQETPCHIPAGGEEIWTLWRREAAAQERTVREKPRRRGLRLGLSGLLSPRRREALERH